MLGNLDHYIKNIQCGMVQQQFTLHLRSSPKYKILSCCSDYVYNGLYIYQEKFNDFNDKIYSKRTWILLVTYLLLLKLFMYYFSALAGILFGRTVHCMLTQKK